MERILDIIENNDVCQINISKYVDTVGTSNLFNIPIYLVSKSKRIVVCLPDRMSVKLCLEYLKYLMPTMRIGYADGKDVSYNLSTQIIYVTSSYLKYKMLRCFKDNAKHNNFADIIIMFNPDINNYDDIFTISTVKYANRNNISLPKFVIINYDNSNMLCKNFLDLKTGKIKILYKYIESKSKFSKINNVVSIIQSEYRKYQSNILVYVSDKIMADFINYNILRVIPDANIITINNDDNEFSNNYKDLFEIKSEKIIIAINIEEFLFSDIGVVIDTVQQLKLGDIFLQHHSNVLGYCKPNKCYRLSTEKEYLALESNESNENKKEFNIVKDLSNLLLDYIHCDINFDDLKLDKINNKLTNVIIEDTIKTMLNLNQIGFTNDKYSVLQGGIFLTLIELSPQKSNFIWDWITKEYPIFPGLIIVSLIQENYSSMINKDSHPQWLDKSPIHTYLNMINSFSMEHNKKLYNIIKYFDNKHVILCRAWAQRNLISTSLFINLILNIHKLYNIICSNLRDINSNIAPFNTQEMIRSAVPILQNIYQKQILIIKNNYIIQPFDNVSYVINKSHINVKLKDDKIIAFNLRSFMKNKRNMMSVDIFVTI